MQTHRCSPHIFANMAVSPGPYGIVRDERESFEAAIARALPECDVLLLTGGSSKDDRDMTAAVIPGSGEVLVHGIAIAPGKPTIIGRIGEKPGLRSPWPPCSRLCGATSRLSVP